MSNIQYNALMFRTLPAADYYLVAVASLADRSSLEHSRPHGAGGGRLEAADLDRYAPR